VLLLGLAAGMVSSAAQSAAQARAAADLSALAAARVLRAGLVGRGGPAPCAVAVDVAARNRAKVSSCVVDGHVNVTVRVSVTLSHRGAWLPDRFAAAASARAGPAP